MDSDARETFERIIKASQGNFDHLMGQLRRVAKFFNHLESQFGDLDEFVNGRDDNPLLPPGGTTGQILAKASDDDYDVEWVDP